MADTALQRMLGRQGQGFAGQLFQRRQPQVRGSNNEHPALPTQRMGEVEERPTFRRFAQRGTHVCLSGLEQVQTLGDRPGRCIDKLQPGQLRNGGQYIAVEACPIALAIAKQVRWILAADHRHLWMAGDPLPLLGGQYDAVMGHIRA
ncbi:hypothetical protein D3C76_1318920 [compost metagenome]